jgi:hypothetical protein
MTVEDVKDKDKKYCFQIQTPTKTFILCTDVRACSGFLSQQLAFIVLFFQTEDAYREWTEAVKNNLQKAVQIARLLMPEQEQVFFFFFSATYLCLPLRMKVIAACVLSTAGPAHDGGKAEASR